MTVCAISILAGFLASGCQKGSSLEQFSNQVSRAKSFRVEATLKVDSESRPITILRKLPNQAKTTSKELVALVSDKSGWLEVNDETKKYASNPWMGKFLPGLGKLVTPGMTSFHFAYGITPLQIAPAKSWKLSNVNGSEVWTAIVESQMGPQKYEFEIGAQGELKRYLNPNGEFTVSKWEIDPGLEDSEFTMTVPDGFVMLNLPVEYMSLAAGQKLDFSKMKDNGKNKLGSKWSLVLFCDPADPISMGMKNWLSRAKFDAAKLEVSLGSGGDYSVSDDKAFWDMVSATPTCVLADKEGIVRALWQGFDPSQTARLEKEVNQAMKEHS